MGKINLASLALWLGAIGQSLLLGHLLDRFSSWLSFLPFLGPWILVFVISFCRIAPCGPTRFAQLLVFAMGWYSLNTLGCEMVWLFVPSGRSSVYSATIPHVLAYGSAISFIVFVDAVREARRYEVEQAAMTCDPSSSR